MRNQINKINYLKRFCRLLIITLSIVKHCWGSVIVYVQHYYSFQRLRPVAETAGGVVSIRLKVSFFLGLESVFALVSRSLPRFGSVAVELLVSEELRTDDKSSFAVDFRGRVSELVRSLRLSFCFSEFCE